MFFVHVSELINYHQYKTSFVKNRFIEGCLPFVCFVHRYLKRRFQTKNYPLTAAMLFFHHGANIFWGVNRHFPQPVRKATIWASAFSCAAMDASKLSMQCLWTSCPTQKATRCKLQMLPFTLFFVYFRNISDLLPQISCHG